MGVPTLALYIQGQGSVSGDALDTFVQGALNVSQLRSFSGVSNMAIFMQGYVSNGDGGQGFFYWNATSTGTDDGGVTVIAPAGTATGRWLRLGYLAAASSALLFAPYTVANLPVGGGAPAFATNGRKIGEGAAAGTGVPVYYSLGAWRVFSTDAPVLA